MNSLERTLITKSGYDHGWEVVVEESPDRVVLASALHRARVEIFSVPPTEGWVVMFSPEQLLRELRRTAPGFELTDEHCGAWNEAELGNLLQHAARIARALPDAPEVRFKQAVKKQLEAKTITTTEVERLVRQRIGQDIYRESLMDYWGGACSVTGTR